MKKEITYTSRVYLTTPTGASNENAIRKTKRIPSTVPKGWLHRVWTQWSTLIERKKRRRKCRVAVINYR